MVAAVFHTTLQGSRDMRPTHVYFAAILALSNYVHAARILGLFPHTGKSHQMVFEPLLKKLADRGHHLTVASFFPLKNPPANYTDISFEGIATLGLESFDLNWYEDKGMISYIPVVSRLVNQLWGFHPLSWMAVSVCTKAVDWPPLKEALNKEYDLVFVENFNSDCMLGLLHVYGIKAPVVALLTSGLMPWSADRIGVADNPAYVPVISTEFTTRMTYWERLENTFVKIYHKLWYRYLVQEKEQEIIEKHFGRKIPDLEDLGRNISLMMLNTYHALNGPMPLAPGLIQIGGMHLDPTRKVIPKVCLFVVTLKNISMNYEYLFSINRYDFLIK